MSSRTRRTPLHRLRQPPWGRLGRVVGLVGGIAGLLGGIAGPVGIARAGPPGDRAPAPSVPSAAPAAVAAPAAASPVPSDSPQEIPTSDSSDISEETEEDLPSRAPGIDLVPRQLGLHAGWVHLVRDDLPIALIDDPRPRPHGVAGGLSALWQVRGLAGSRWPVWIGGELGLDALPATATSRRLIALGLGLLVKHQFGHQFGRHPRIRPFLAYGVGATSAWIRTLEGREDSLRLRLGLGAAIPIGERTSVALELVYRHQGAATLRWDGAGTLRYPFQTLGLAVSLLFDSPARPARRRRGSSPGSQDRNRTPGRGRS